MFSFVIDGVFDHRVYTEKALGRLTKARAKADRAVQRSAPSSAAPSKAPTPSLPDDNAPTPDNASTHTVESVATKEKETPASRSELLRSKPQLVAKFTSLLVPVLVDVYAASVAPQIRTKTLTGLLKAVSFLEGDDLKKALKVSEAFRLII